MWRSPEDGEQATASAELTGYMGARAALGSPQWLELVQRRSCLIMPPPEQSCCRSGNASEARRTSLLGHSQTAAVEVMLRW